MATTEFARCPCGCYPSIVERTHFGNGKVDRWYVAACSCCGREERVVTRSKNIKRDLIRKWNRTYRPDLAVRPRRLPHP